MSPSRPSVAPDVLANLIESAPQRVRSRLDRTPHAAVDWPWQLANDRWTIQAGGETVTLPTGTITTIEQVACTCLLAPLCFHVLAVLTQLEVAVGEPLADAEAASAEPPPAADLSPGDAPGDDDAESPTPTQRHAAEQLRAGLIRLLHVGVAQAGVSVQSGVLRAVHHCRAEGLHRAAALGLRIAAGVTQVRGRSPEADAPQLANDLAEALETVEHLVGPSAVDGFWLGTARRRQWPVRPRRLAGVLAEPIITRSGFAGAVVYFLGEDDRLYTASDVRPGEPRRALDAYQGGIELGPLVQPGRQLARSQYLGTDLTASEDGRLGRGQTVKVVHQGASSWASGAVAQRFASPWANQLEAVFRHATTPPDRRPAGWDLLFVTLEILAAQGEFLLARCTTSQQVLRLAIGHENDVLCYRTNLQALSRLPGAVFQVIARVELARPAELIPLAIAEPADLPTPRLALPESWGGRVNVGLDELTAQRLATPEPRPAELAGAPPDDQLDPLATVRRRWVASLLAGTAMQRASQTAAMTHEAAALCRAGFTTAAALLERLAHPEAASGGPPAQTFLATALYLRAAQAELARSQWMLQFE